MNPSNESELSNFNDNLKGDDMNLKRFVSLFISNWYWFAFSLLIALSIAYGINRYGDRYYAVSSSLLIKDQQVGGGSPNAENFIPGAGLFSSQQNLKNEIGILQSFNLNMRVIDSLPDFRIEYFGVGKRNLVERRLYKSCPFIVETDSIDFQPHYVKVAVRILSDTKYELEVGNSKNAEEYSFGQKYRKNGFKFMIVLREPERFRFNSTASNKYYFYFNNIEDIVNQYRFKLGISPIDKDASLVTISVTGAVAQQEADYLNKLMETYIGQGLEVKNRTADSTITFIDRQLGIIADSLKNAEDKLQKFRQQNRIIDVTQEGSIILNKIEAYENERNSIILQEQYYNYLQEYINSKERTGDIVAPSTVGLSDPELNRFVVELSTLQKDLRKLNFNYSENLVSNDLINQNIDKVKKALTENIINSKNNIALRLRFLDGNIANANKEVDKLPLTEREFIKIQRDFDINNTVYTYLLEKRAETGIAKASTISDNKIIDRAYVFNAVPIKPKTKANRTKAIIIGLSLPALMILLLYFLNNRVLDNIDIMQRTNVPIIGYVSHNISKKEIPTLENPGSSLSESFRAIRTTLQYLIQENNNPVISITSTVSAEGKSFVSLNLAVITALLGKKVLLVGLDLRKPRIHKILGLENNIGLSSFLSNNAEISDIIKQTSIKNLYYALSGPVPPNPAELINSNKMKEFIEFAKNEFDYTFIDTPPIAIVTDTFLLSDFTDINLFIVRQRFSSKNTLELIQQIYQSKRFRNMGIIVNDISLTGYFGYGLRYGYYKGYGYSYGKDYYGTYANGHYGYKSKNDEYLSKS